MRSFSMFKSLIMMVLICVSIIGKGFTQGQTGAPKIASEKVRTEGKTDYSNGLPKDLLTGVVELRDYRLRPGKRDDFIKYFKEHFVTSQNEAGSQILGLFRVKGSDNNFFWIRGFSSMAARKAYLPAFYYGPVWKTFGHGANDMLSNNDDVHLLKPLSWDVNSQVTNVPIHVSINENYAGITVVTFYTCNNKLDKMIDFVSKTYLQAYKTFHVGQISFWVSELAENDFPKLPVFQDKNLLVSIAHYKDEAEFKKVTEQIVRSLTPAQRNEFDDVATKTEALILYPVKK
jgi:quinol monooxygenase YgiN